MSIDQIAQWDRLFAERFPRRFNGKQKEPFLQALDGELRALGFATERINFRTFGFPNRLLATRCASPAVIFLAHYDTPMIMPFWISPIYRLFGHTRQVASTLFLCFLIWLIPGLAALLPQVPYIEAASSLFIFVLLASFVVMLFANPSNREDNTSGVIGLLALAERVKDQPRLKDRVQFVFLDNEEWGLLGSSGLKQLWDQQKYAYAGAAIISLDCVSRGSVPLVIYHHQNPAAQKILPYLQKYLPGARTFNMKWVPLSDNYTFRKEGAIDISLADPALIPGGYYIPRIHVPADRDFSAEKLEQLVAGINDYLADRILTEPST